MSEKILLIFGSPRKNGNTSIVTKWFIEGAESNGATVEVVNANTLKNKVPGCSACMGCQKSDKRECVIDDEVAAVIKRIPEFDALVIATPIYFFGPSAQVKIVMDRMFALDKFNIETGEHLTDKNRAAKAKMVLIATAGGGLDTGLNLLDTTFKMVSDFTGICYESLLVPFCGFNPNSVMQKKDIREKAILFGQNIAASR
ncbi:MAG: hypothetical protein A2X78_02060 [Gammaproteobacteria bacterium GWE2_37_16]|nr:MAG: hypothetical protein A2X78_02060 [Gammaproteobacteria bacterium GWE2_37_16]